jgi:hypothetical protein
MAQGSGRVLVPVLVMAPEWGWAPEQVLAPVSGLEWQTELAYSREPWGRDRRFHKSMLQGPPSREIPLVGKFAERWTKSSPWTLLKGEFFSHLRRVRFVQRKTHTQTDERRGRPISAGNDQRVGFVDRKRVITTVEPDGANAAERPSENPELAWRLGRGQLQHTSFNRI